MPEVTIASHKWRLPTDEFSPLCDNTLKLNNSTGLVDNPSRLNSFGVCGPACEICVTPIPSQRVKVTNCACEELPRYVDIKLNGGFSHPTIDYSGYNQDYQLKYGPQVVSSTSTDSGCNHYVRLPVMVGYPGGTSLRMSYIIRNFGGLANPGGFTDSDAGPVPWRVSTNYRQIDKRIIVEFHVYGTRQPGSFPQDAYSTFSSIIPPGKTCFDELTLPYVEDSTAVGDPNNSLAVFMRNITKPASITIKPSQF
jgi:hypothetical protein